MKIPCKNVVPKLDLKVTLQSEFFPHFLYFFRVSIKFL
ncbi:hypothetical protein Zm00014a_041219 [Zea mays]|uniref:Uncharacterized protein n=1 Tax=Zea mays TaxID=4577 RepID=A0A3L6DIX7_MAIZE|nr:hypothetical protein Zm00014a_041219 [Zea mays]